MSRVVPIADYLVALPDEPETKTASGIFIPEGAAKKPKVAAVMEVGEQVKYIKARDKIIYREQNIVTIKVESDGDGKAVEFILLKEEDVLAKIES